MVDEVDVIMAFIRGWGLIIIWFVPILTNLGINKKDILNHFKELTEAYVCEKIYNKEFQEEWEKRSSKENKRKKR